MQRQWTKGLDEKWSLATIHMISTEAFALPFHLRYGTLRVGFSTYNLKAWNVTHALSSYERNFSSISTRNHYILVKDPHSAVGANSKAGEKEAFNHSFGKTALHHDPPHSCYLTHSPRSMSALIPGPCTKVHCHKYSCTQNRILERVTGQVLVSTLQAKFSSG